MQLVTATEEHLRTLINWLPDARACLQWGGPTFRYPFTAETFLEDCRWRQLPSYALVDDRGALCAFGQYYERLGRCHLGRLIVSPQRRGQGLGGVLVGELIQRGCAELAVSEASLFVLKDNTVARALYQKLGFACADYPEPFEWRERCDYMTAPAKNIIEEGNSQ